MMADEDFDPEMLEPVAKIRHAEQMIRQEHRILADDHFFWGKLADLMQEAANIPAKTVVSQADSRRFNKFQDLATGYIRMSARLKAEKSDR
jgi:hypothetical protein